MKSHTKKWYLIIILFMCVFLYQFFIGVTAFEETSGQERMVAIERAIQKAAIQCYAIEGSYPPSIAYLTMHYGLMVNTDAYYYHYEVHGANIMPDIAVFRKW